MPIKNWVTGWHWRERILNFTPSWFAVCMGTGVVSQILVNFPYPITGGPRWMRHLGYSFWILDIVLFGFFTFFLLLRYAWHPILFKKTITEFPTSSYLGAIPIALDTIIIGIVSFYGYRDSGRWGAFVVWWISVVLTLLVSFGLLIVQISMQKQHSIDQVAGLWLMTCVPMVVTASAGATQLSSLDMVSQKCAMTVLVVSFLLWSCGLVQVHLILAVYFWRLVSNKIPQPQQVASGMLPLAPLGQGAYAAQQMSIYLSNYLKSSGYGPTQSQPPPVPQTVLLATGEALHWLGILVSLFLLAEATLWLVQSLSAVIKKHPKKFSIGLWSLTFPWGSYTNGWEYLSRDLRNDGMRGWATFNFMCVILVWLFCAFPTAYLGIWKGSLFYAPGLEEWIEPEDEKKESERQQQQQDGQGQSQRNGHQKQQQQQQNRRRSKWNGTYEMDPPGPLDEEKQGED